MLFLLIVFLFLLFFALLAIFFKIFKQRRKIRKGKVVAKKVATCTRQMTRTPKAVQIQECQVVLVRQLQEHSA